MAAGRKPITARARLYVGAGRNDLKTRLPVSVDSDAFRDTVNRVVAARFEGATIEKARGYYLGRFEPSLVIDVWHHGLDRSAFLAECIRAAHDLVQALDQISVAVVVPDGRGGESVSYVDAKTIAARRERRGRYAATS